MTDRVSPLSFPDSFARTLRLSPFARRLAAAGVPVRAHRFDGLFHGFLTFPSLSLTPPARERLWAMMRDALAPSAPADPASH